MTSPTPAPSDVEKAIVEITDSARYYGLRMLDPYSDLPDLRKRIYKLFEEARESATLEATLAERNRLLAILAVHDTDYCKLDRTHCYQVLEEAIRTPANPVGKKEGEV